MARDQNGTPIDNLEAYAIADFHQDPYSLFGTYPQPGVKTDELTFSPELNPLCHASTGPPIYIINSDFSLDSCGYNDTTSPSSFTDTGFFESPVQERSNAVSWDMLSINSDQTYHMQRSLSVAGTNDTMVGEAWNETLMTSAHLHPNSLPKNFEMDSYEPTNKAESVSSTDSFIENPFEPMQTEPIGDASNPPPLTFFSVSHDGSSGSLVANATTGGPRPRGRRGHLKPEQRAGAARMRKVGACKMCKDRKARCDGGKYTIYCGACIKYWRGKGKPPPNPCRGSRKAFQSLAEVILRGHVFPKHRELTQYLGEKFEVGTEVYPIHLSLGFGAHFQADIRLIKTDESDKLVHRHIVYPWQPESNVPSKKKSKADYVFPAILANTEVMPTVLEHHIERLLDEESSFTQFPLYKSEFQILGRIWRYYLNLPKKLSTLTDGRTTLRQALKLLILIHIGGDIKLDDGCHSQAHEIVAQIFPEIGDTETVIATPCFIRGQMGPILAKMAKTLMWDVLGRLEVLSLTPDNCQYFPIILSTFAVLFMAVESIQYHAAKESYHTSYDTDIDRHNERIHVLDNEAEGVENLLNFYANCFGNCHANMHEPSVSSFQHFAAAAARSASGVEGERERTIEYLQSIKMAIDHARPYLLSKIDNMSRNEKLEKGDMSVYFDRLLAKLFLTKA